MLKKSLFVVLALMCTVAIADAGMKLPGSAAPGTSIQVMPIEPAGPPCEEHSVDNPEPFPDYITWFGGTTSFFWDDGKYVHARTGATIEIFQIYGLTIYVLSDSNGNPIETGLIV